MKNIHLRNRVLTICDKEDPILNSNDIILLHPSKRYNLSDLPYMMEENTTFKHLAVTQDENHSEDELFNTIVSKNSIQLGALFFYPFKFF